VDSPLARPFELHCRRFGCPNVFTGGRSARVVRTIRPSLKLFMSIYIARPNPALQRPVLLLLCGARACVAAMMRDHRAARCLNRSTLCGAEVWAVPASWARQIGRSVPRVCSLFRSSLVASAVLLDGGLPGRPYFVRHDSQCPRDVVSFIFHLSITCPACAAIHELISW